MTITLSLIFAAKAKSTHHKLALDALRHLRGPSSEKWRDTLLSYADNYLLGAKAPDDEFKDFKNHVLHVSDNFWGGAVGAAKNWYGHLLSELRAKNWSEAAYCAGVLSHYYTDPLMPFHTGQSEAEGAVHRAAEWSITKSYEILQSILLEKLGGWPEVEPLSGADWLRDAIHAGASLAHPHYDFLIDHYNLDQGVKNPPLGLDEPSREILAQLLGYAAVGFARILDRAFEEAAVAPPSTQLSPQAFFSTLGAPISAIAKKFSDQKERAQILAMYDEYVATGKCVVTLPEDDRVVRANYAKEVLKVPLSQLDVEKPRKPGQQFGVGSAPRIVAISKAITLPKATSHRPTSQRNERAQSLGSADSAAEQIEQKEASAFEIREADDEGLRPQEATGVSLRASEATNDEVATVSLQNLPPQRTIRQVASQLQQSIAPGAKRAASAVTSLVRRLKPVAKPSNEVPSGKTNEPKVAKQGAVSAFLSRFKSTPKVAAKETASDTGTIEFVPAVEKKKKPAPVANNVSAGKFYLELNSSVEDGPSIGPKMAARMAASGVKTVEEFLRADAIQLGAKLGFNATASAKIKDWQDQARLVCRIPNLRGHDSQILINCGIRDPKALASANATALTKAAIEFAKSSEGQRLLRGASMPDAEEVNDWIEWAQSARGLKAA